MDRTVRNVMSDLSGLKKLVKGLRDRFDEYERSKVFDAKRVLEKELKTSDTKVAPSGSSKQKTVPQSKQPIDDVPTPDEVHFLDSEDTGTSYLPKVKPRAKWLTLVPKEERSKTPEPDWVVPANGRVPPTAYDQLNLVNPEGHRAMPGMRKPLPLRGLPSQVTIQTQYFFNKDLEYLVSREKGRRTTLSIPKLKAAYYLYFGLEELVPSLWIESEREYDISAAYVITHWWFRRKEFYITRHSASSDCRSVRSHMQILSVISLKTYERYGYTYLKEIVLRRADYKEYKISKANFKNLHPNVFEDMYLLHLQGKLNHLPRSDKDASDFFFKEDFTIVPKPKVVIYRDMNDQKKMMWENEVHKFCNGTLRRFLEKLDHMVKDFRLFKYKPRMDSKIWSEDDKRRSKEFMKVIERRLKIKRIFWSLESFVGGRFRDVDYRTLNRKE
nr:hypothetical protein [Tanacetum cinerariifolium]